MSSAQRGDPYRSPWVCEERTFTKFDVEILSIFALVWCGSVVRVVLGHAHHEAFGAEFMLATVTIATFPFALMKS